MENQDFTIGQIKPVECYKQGWEIIKSDYWLFFAIALVGGLIGGMSLYILLGVMICGIFYANLQKIDHGIASFDNLWKGFGFFVPSLIVTLFIVVPMIFVYAIIYVPIIFAAMMGPNLNPEEFMGILIGAFAVDAVLIVLMVCFHTLLMFSFPLIIDRNLSAFQAMKTSMKAVWKNLGGVTGLIGVQIVLMLLGMLTCGIGIYFLMPILMAGFAVAYRQVFPAGQNFQTPPPPNAFSGAGSYT